MKNLFREVGEAEGESGFREVFKVVKNLKDDEDQERSMTISRINLTWGFPLAELCAAGSRRTTGARA